ncbi:hypothetical protein LXL04_038039 [Taraxacum kok-saghyz]
MSTVRSKVPSMVLMTVDTAMVDVEGTTMAVAAVEDMTMVTVAADVEDTTLAAAVEGTTTVVDDTMVVVEEAGAGMDAAAVDVTTAGAGVAALLKRRLHTNKPKLTTDRGFMIEPCCNLRSVSLCLVYTSLK